MKPIVVCTLLAFVMTTHAFADPARPKLSRNDVKTSTIQNVNSTANTVTNPPQCQQNDVLSKLLLQLLLSSVTTTTTQNPLVEGLNRLLGISPSPGLGKAQTTVFTSTTVSTVTQVFSTVLSVMFKAKRIPTTIYSSSVVTVTELQTITSTLGAPEPTALFRLKRDANHLESLVEPSVADMQQEPIQPTHPLKVDVTTQESTLSSEDAAYWMAVLNHPEVRQAWEQFIEVLNKVKLDI